MLANVWLAFFLLHRLTGSVNAAFLGAALLAHHPLMLELLYSSGTIYEILCFLFYFLAVYWYFRWRERGWLSWKRVVLLVILTGCAIDSKEMAMTLPAALLLMEWIYFRDRFSWRGPLATAALVVPAIAVKVLTSNPLSNDPSYSGHSLHQWVENMRAYQGFLLYKDLFAGGFPVLALVALWTAMAAVALLVRSKPMIFGLSLLFVSLLPVCLIDRRGGYLLYLPAFGWALYATAFLERACAAVRRRSVLYLALLLAFAFTIPRLHAKRLNPYSQSYEREQSAMRSLMERLREARPRLPRRARILLMDDPLAPGYGPLLIARIAYHDPELEVDRLRTAPADTSGYDVVLTW